MIYFDKEHNAYGDELSIVGKEIVFTCDDSLWIDFQKNPNKYIWVDNEIVNNPEYEDILAQEREENFKSKFFEILNFGWFRKEPKGYSSAVESLNTAFNAVSILQKLPANTLIFYQQPDFYDAEQCTEEWLIEHQTFNEEMTIQEFGDFYMAFMTAWNNEMHEKLTEESNEEEDDIQAED